MKAVIQRVSTAKVVVGDRTVGEIEKGLLTLLGFEKGDTEEALKRLIDKILKLRIFEDSAGKMNLSLADIQGGHLIVSQFTLAADCSEGRRPSFGRAEAPERARELYALALEQSRASGLRTQGGEFQADMKVHLVNDGPATFVLNENA